MRPRLGRRRARAWRVRRAATGLALSTACKTVSEDQDQGQLLTLSRAPPLEIDCCFCRFSDVAATSASAAMVASSSSSSASSIGAAAAHADTERTGDATNASCDGRKCRSRSSGTSGSRAFEAETGEPGKADGGRSSDCGSAATDDAIEGRGGGWALKPSRVDSFGCGDTTGPALSERRRGVDATPKRSADVAGTARRAAAGKAKVLSAAESRSRSRLSALINGAGLMLGGGGEGEGHGDGLAERRACCCCFSKSSDAFGGGVARGESRGFNETDRDSDASEYCCCCGCCWWP